MSGLLRRLGAQGFRGLKNTQARGGGAADWPHGSSTNLHVRACPPAQANSGQRVHRQDTMGFYLESCP
eukprot:scaffold186520_cov14-Tisochrysis_lutea.AAC.1